MCVPQHDVVAQELTIASIASYVTCASVFLVLAGPWEHKNGTVRDVRAWSHRGWCRFEQLCNALSPNRKPLLLAESATSIFSFGPAGIAGRFWFLEPVGRGDFTVRADAERLKPVMTDLIEARISLARADNE
jgi:hypothetical protein